MAKLPKWGANTYKKRTGAYSGSAKRSTERYRRADSSIAF